MMLGPDWIDAMTEPTVKQAQTAKAMGYHAVGFYIGGHGVDPAHVWSQTGVDTVRSAGLIPIPIYVPTPTLPTPAKDAATEALRLSRDRGCNPLVSILYNGNHEQPTTGPVWLPIWGNRPTAVGPTSSIQYGGTKIAGWQVDISVSAPDFPFSSGLAVDFEYNTNYNPAWYAEFQQTISDLTSEVPVVADFTVNDIVAAVMLAMRQQFAGGELYDRIIRACNDSIAQNGIVGRLNTLETDLDTRGADLSNVLNQIYMIVTEIQGANKSQNTANSPGN